MKAQRETRKQQRLAEDEAASKRKIAEKEESTALANTSTSSIEKEAVIQKKSEGPKTFVKNGVIVTDIGKRNEFRHNI